MEAAVDVQQARATPQLISTLLLLRVGGISLLFLKKKTKMGSTVMETNKDGSKKTPKRRRRLRINMPVSRGSINSWGFSLRLLESHAT